MNENDDQCKNCFSRSCDLLALLSSCDLTQSQAQNQSETINTPTSSALNLRVDDRMVWTRSVDQKSAQILLKLGQSAQVRFGTTKEEYTIGADSKGLKGLPKHTQLTIKAVPHFIDDWQGETAYLISEDNNGNGIAENYYYVNTREDGTIHLPTIMDHVSALATQPRQTLDYGTTHLVGDWAQISKSASQILKEIPLKISEKPSLSEIYAYALVNQAYLKGAIFGAVIGLNTSKEDKSVPLLALIAGNDLASATALLAKTAVENDDLNKELKKGFRFYNSTQKNPEIKSLIKAIQLKDVEGMTTGFQSAIKNNPSLKPALFGVVLGLNTSKEDKAVPLDVILDSPEVASVTQDQVIAEAILLLNKASGEKSAKALESVKTFLLNASHFLNQDFQFGLKNHLQLNAELAKALETSKTSPFVVVVNKEIIGGDLILNDVSQSILLRIRKKPEILFQAWENEIENYLTEIQNNPLHIDNNGVEMNPLFSEAN